MTSSPELPVPDAAVDTFGTAVHACEVAGGSDDAVRASVRAIAGPVMAADYRALAGELEKEAETKWGGRENPYALGLLDAARGLRARGDQLDLPVSSR